MQRTTRAAILVEQKQKLAVAEIVAPSELDVGQVLVRVHYSGICGSQLGEIDGVKGADRFLPHLLGHEGAGIVVAIGPGVRHVQPNDKVVLHWRRGLGIEAQPAKYLWDGRTVNSGWVTTFNEWAVVSENRLTVLPSNSDLRLASLFGCAVTTGFGVVVNNANLKPGESVVVFGAGGVGLNIVQAAALVSAYPIIAVDLYDNKLALARTLGASHLINATSEDATTRICEIIGTRGLDVFIDNTGKPDIIQAGYAMVQAAGRVILVGVPKAAEKITIHSLPLHFGKVLTGSHGGDSVPHIDIPRYYGMYLNGCIELNALVTARYPLADINVAIQHIRSGDVAGRCVIEMP